MTETLAGKRDTAVTSLLTTRATGASQVFQVLFRFIFKPPKYLYNDSLESPGMSLWLRCANVQRLGRDVLLSKPGWHSGVTGDRPPQHWAGGSGPILALLSSPAQHLSLLLVHRLLGARSFSLLTPVPKRLRTPCESILLYK